MKNNCIKYFELQSGEIEKTLRWLRKGNLKKETESIQITVQNNYLSKNYVKVKKKKNDNMQQKSK